MKARPRVPNKFLIRFTFAVAIAKSVAIARASELDRLARRGYGVYDTTNVVGEFKGCESNRQIALANGLIFLCLSYSYHYAYSPEVLILKNVRSNDLKVIIDDEEFDGTLYRLKGK